MFVMGVFMPKIFLPNLEENHIENAPAEVFLNDIEKYFWQLDDDDVIVSSVAFNEIQLNYIKKIKKLTTGFKCILLQRKSNPYYLVDSIIQDTKTLAVLQALCKNGNYYLEPYTQSKKVVQLAEALKTSFNQTNFDSINKGLIDQINSKSWFKNYCIKYKVPTPRGYHLRNTDKLKRYLKLINYKENKKVILKQSLSGGGYGNIAGTAEELLALAKGDSTGNPHVIEHYLNFNHVCGTLAKLNEFGTEFIGVDTHISERESWQGLTYPIADQETKALLKKHTLTLANAFHNMGARGLFNIDFGIQKLKDQTKAFALEANFRHNGFSLILNFAKPGRFLHYYKNYNTSAQNFAQALSKLKKLHFATDKPLLASDIDAPCGIILVDCAQNSGKCGIVTFGQNPASINQMLNIIQGQFVI